MKNQITRTEISEAVSRFISSGGKIEKIKFKDNGFLLNNDLLMDQNYNSEPTILDGIQVENVLEPGVVN